jgi:prefoldin subunit 5
MTDEQFHARIDRLIERHEALAQSVELMNHQIGDLSSQIGDLTGAARQDAENIRALARIAEIHERRLTSLEGGEG